MSKIGQKLYFFVMRNTKQSFWCMTLNLKCSCWCMLLNSKQSLWHVTKIQTKVFDTKAFPIGTKSITRTMDCNFKVLTELTVFGK